MDRESTHQEPTDEWVREAQQIKGPEREYNEGEKDVGGWEVLSHRQEEWWRQVWKQEQWRGRAWNLKERVQK